MTRTSPTQRSLAHARKQGWPVAVVEKWVPGRPGGGFGHRVDLWGCLDLLVLDECPGVLGVQACAGASHAARATKIRGLLSEDSDHGKALRRWLELGLRIEVWSWAKRGARGKRKLWELRVEHVDAPWCSGSTPGS